MCRRQLLAIPLFVGVLGATLTLPASAQSTNTTTDRTVTTKVDKVDRGFDWGWLGLLGLAGLMGLKPRDRTDYTTRPKV